MVSWTSKGERKEASYKTHGPGLNHLTLVQSLKMRLKKRILGLSVAMAPWDLKNPHPI